MCSRNRLSLFGLLLFVLLASPTLLSGCGASSPSPENASPPRVQEEVLERAEGFNERPGWADENQPFTRKAETLRVVGYVAIDEKQKLDMGYRVSDSYARAELVRFLASRVQAVLLDKVGNDDSQVISERITDQAGAWVNELHVAERYWEKRSAQGAKKRHIWSRIDLSPQQMSELVKSVTQQSEGLENDAKTLSSLLDKDWNKVADPMAWDGAQAALPPGVFVPDWAKVGDKSSETEFQFVCHGLAADEDSAQILAQSRCSEKLCRLFGVQITAETTVIEDMDGFNAETKVKERCADVRVVGRETKYHTASCGPQGCVYWLQQSYPNSEFLTEKERLSQPAIIRQQIVIQEGTRKYRDPAQCRKSLQDYAQVKGIEHKNYLARSKYLRAALQTCQDIDGRDAGLFESLNHLLMKPIKRFTTTSKNPYDTRLFFLHIGSNFFEDIKASRFLVERLQLVLGIIEGGLLAAEVDELNGASQAKVERVMKKVIALPFASTNLSRYHLGNVQSFAMGVVKGRSAVRYSRVLRDYLVMQADKKELRCRGSKMYDGGYLLEYLGSDGSLDDEEWKVAIRMLKRSKDVRDVHPCLWALWGRNKRATRARIDQVAKMLVTGELPTKDTVNSFRTLIRSKDDQQRLDAYRRWRTRLTGKKEARKNLVRDLTSDFFPFPRKEGDCAGRPALVQKLNADFPEFNLDHSLLCVCLRTKYSLPAEERRMAISLLHNYSNENGCGSIEESEWPGGYYKGAPRQAVAQRGASPLGNWERSFENQIRSCQGKGREIGARQFYITIVAVVKDGHLRQTQVKALALPSSQSLSYPDKRPGYVHTTDIHRVNAEVGQCVKQAVEGAAIHERSPAATSPSKKRIFFDYWGANRGANIYLDE